MYSSRKWTDYCNNNDMCKKKERKSLDHGYEFCSVIYSKNKTVYSFVYRKYTNIN